MFQLYGPDMWWRFGAIPAMYIEWRGGVFAEAGRGEDQAEYSHSAGRALADDPAATATEGDVGKQRGCAVDGSGRLPAERLWTRATEADIAAHRRVQSRTAKAGEAVIPAKSERNRCWP